MSLRFVFLFAVLSASLLLPACDTNPAADTLPESSVASPSYFDSVRGGVGDDPMVPTMSFSRATRSGAAAVRVVDGRLHFDDVSDYRAFLEMAMDWTKGERLTWEVDRGFVSLQTVNEDTTADRATSQTGEAIAMPDPVAGASLSPTGTIGVGDRVYDIEGSQVRGYDLDGNLVGTRAALIECGPEALTCDDGGGGGTGGGGTGGGSDPPSETRYVGFQFGPIESSNPNVSRRYKLTATIFRVHYFIYSSIGSEMYSHVHKYTGLRGHFYADHIPYSAEMFCMGYYDKQGGGTMTSPRTILLNQDGFRPQDSVFRVYYDFDIFDFTGTGSLRRIECDQNLVSNRRSYGGEYINDANISSGSVETSRNF